MVVLLRYPAESWLLNREERQLMDFGRRYHRSLALKFTVNKLHFLAPDDKINLTCQAVIPNYEEPLVKTKLVSNLHKSHGYVAAQGSHYKGDAESAYRQSWDRFLLMATLFAVAMSKAF
ncbi:hypothetical protein M8J77_002551 [Diaphorina citri]|nr:hypothetical protein M8J77_002551 [Diaphorina citri]